MTWTSVKSVAGPSWTNVPSILAVHNGEVNGSPIGLLLALTYSITGTSWTGVASPSTSWTKVTNPS